MPGSGADKVAVAVIGAGFIADYHISGLNAAGGADVTTLVGRRYEVTAQRARSLGIPRVETDYRKVDTYEVHTGPAGFGNPPVGCPMSPAK